MTFFLKLAETVIFYVGMHTKGDKEFGFGLESAGLGFKKTWIRSSLVVELRPAESSNFTPRNSEIFDSTFTIPKQQRIRHKDNRSTVYDIKSFFDGYRYVFRLYDFSNVITKRRS
jgi:hypothetical protein